MSAQQDAAIIASANADAITLQANVLNTSQLHFAGNAAHNSAVAAWNVVGTPSAKVAAHTAQAAIHLTTAIQLKAAGK
jgi:hypothetical protein